MKTTDGDWHLDKRVPISLILAFVLQTAIFISLGAWYAGKMDTRVAHIEAWVSGRPAVLPADLEQRITAVEVNQRNILRALSRIEDKVDSRFDGLTP